MDRVKIFNQRVEEWLNNEFLQATVKHGGGPLQVWGYILANRVRNLVRISGVLNTVKLSIMQYHKGGV